MESEIIWITVGVIVMAFVFASLMYITQRENTRAQELLESVTTAERGNCSERDLVLKLLKSGIPAGAIFHDLYIKKSHGFSQIDLVVATKVGIIVFEVKDYSGWIFGRGDQNNWTQVLDYGREKHRFYNPIMQNSKHIAELRRQLWREKAPFYSIVVFYGNCELRDISFVPNGTFITKDYRVLDAINEIIENNKPANYTDKREVVRVLREAVKNGDNAETKDQHIENVRDMLGKDRVFD
ncbi:MAG: NERD domain-containing protein [Rickettsiales bacterium]|jgi:hypothetical protein|nr:NERD domain-containing protein [Rickettsiales bacterium]